MTVKTPTALLSDALADQIHSTNRRAPAKALKNKGAWSWADYAPVIRLPPHYLTRVLSLKIGRMIDIAMKPTMLPMRTIINGSIMAVTPLMTARSSRE